MHITLSFRLELSKEDKQKTLSLMRMQSSSVRIAYNTLKEGSTKRPFSSETFAGGRGVGQGEEQVSSLRGWGDVPMRDFRNSLTAYLIIYAAKAKDKKAERGQFLV